MNKVHDSKIILFDVLVKHESINHLFVEQFRLLKIVTNLSKLNNKS